MTTSIKFHYLDQYSFPLLNYKLRYYPKEDTLDLENKMYWQQRFYAENKEDCFSRLTNKTNEEVVNLTNDIKNHTFNFFILTPEQIPVFEHIAELSNLDIVHKGTPAYNANYYSEEGPRLYTFIVKGKQ